MCLLLESNQLTEMSTKLVDNLNKTNGSQNEDYDKISVSIYRKAILITSEELQPSLRATKNVQQKIIKIAKYDNNTMRNFVTQISGCLSKILGALNYNIEYKFV